MTSTQGKKRDFDCDSDLTRSSVSKRLRSSQRAVREDDDEPRLVIDLDTPLTSTNDTNDCPLDLTVRPKQVLQVIPDIESKIPLAIPIHFNEYVDGVRKSRHCKLNISISQSMIDTLSQASSIGNIIIGPLGPKNVHFRVAPDIILNNRSEEGKNANDVVSCKAATGHKLPFPDTGIKASASLMKPRIFVRQDKKTLREVGAVDFGLEMKKGTRMFISFFIEGTKNCSEFRYLETLGSPIEGKMSYFSTPKLLKGKIHHFIVFAVVLGARTPFSDCFCITG